MNKESNDDRSNDDRNDAKEQTRCFVCDDEVLGRYYALATCRTQSSRSRVIEKLGELVGEGYMVVISEDDVICRSCGILINTLDRLEVEMRKARDHILHFLERKYSLRDGELCGSDDRPKPCQPPQITRSGMKEIACYTKLPNQNEDFNSGEETNRILMKSHSWLQCDRCKYTTHLNSFMVHHLRDHIKGKLFCDNCGHLLIQQTKKHNCNKANDLGNKENKTDNSDKNDTTETIHLGQTQSTLPITQTMPPPLIGLSNCDHLYISNTLSTKGDSQIPTSSQKPIYILQSIDKPDSDNTKMAKSNSDPTQKTETNKGKDKKHLLILKDDGSLEMVEIPYEMEANIESVFE